MIDIALTAYARSLGLPSIVNVEENGYNVFEGGNLIYATNSEETTRMVLARAAERETTVEGFFSQLYKPKLFP